MGDSSFGRANAAVGTFATFEGWKLGVDVGQCLLDLGEHLFVVGPRLAARARWAEVFVQALAAPRGFDEQPRFVEMVAQTVADL